MIAKTPQPPYYAVIFSNIRTLDDKGYLNAAKRMEVLAKQQKGFLGIESVRNNAKNAEGITVSYWDSIEAILNWKNNAEHEIVRKQGKEIWYEKFQVRICKVEREYGFEK